MVVVTVVLIVVGPKVGVPTAVVAVDLKVVELIVGLVEVRDVEVKVIILVLVSKCIQQYYV